ncbi:hypothetical protein HQ393_05860 [Chitinibacter bivalviorum]|uniref:ArsA HSP20-like domain-containing protein n=1 Tax=Chitinibacter bivalviorum TaxID=2739434 RepID=A0A7H9BIM2_9NEIS|nr:hypothetical protein HQ393_05860 [Chitinibacter bivalviorum]
MFQLSKRKIDLSLTAQHLVIHIGNKKRHLIVPFFICAKLK